MQKTLETIDQLANLAPLERIGEPEDIANIAAFLAGPKGGWVNAKVITVESGKSGTGCLTVPSNHGFVVGPMGVSRTTIGGEHVFSVSQSISPAGAAAPMARSILRPPQPALQSFKLLDQVRERF